MKKERTFQAQVRMVAVRVASLRPAELESALAYEVEPQSHISAAEAVVTYRPVVDPDPAVRVFDITVRRRRRSRRLRAADVFALLFVPAALAGVWWYAREDLDQIANRRQALEQAIAFRQRRMVQVVAVQGETRKLKSAGEAVNAEVAKVVAETGRVAAESAKQRTEAKKILDARNAAIAVQDLAESQRAAFGDLFAAIPLAFGQGTVLRRIDATGPLQIRLFCSSVDPVSASEAMQGLAVAVAAKGWTFTPGAIASCEIGSTVTFDCELGH